MTGSKHRRLIVGGGLAGITAALWCRASSAEAPILLLEKEDVLCSSLKRWGDRPLVLGCLEDSLPATENGANGLAQLLSERWPGRFNHDWFEELGCEVWLDAQGVFGARQADQLRQALAAALSAAGIEVRTRFTLESVGVGGGAHLLWSREGQREEGGALLIATGGERNHVLKLMGELGHAVNETGPAYLRLKPASRTLLQELSPWEGIAGIRHPSSGDAVVGHLRISGRGLEGAGLSALSYRLARRWREMQYRLRLEVDFLPMMREAEVRDSLFEAVARARRRPLSEVCPFTFPERFWRGLLKLGKVDLSEAAQGLKRRRVEALAHRLKALPVAIEGIGLPAEERASYGGIDAHSLYPERLESRMVSGLYFAGEVLDVLGSPNGGHLNLMLASAHLAGTALAG